MYGRVCIAVNEILNLAANLRGIALQIRCPFCSDAIQLLFRILNCDIRVKSGGRNRNHVAGHVLQRRVRMIPAATYRKRSIEYQSRSPRVR
jgi:hypothetical protein